MKTYIGIFFFLFLELTVAFAQSIESVNGKKFVFGRMTLTDTILIQDPTTGETLNKIRLVTIPITVDGKTIFDINDVKIAHTPVPLEEQIIKKLQGELDVKSLDNVKLILHLKQVVFDENGKIIYVDNVHENKINITCIASNDIRTLEHALSSNFFDGVASEKGTVNGKKVAFRKTLYWQNFAVEVKNHILIYKKI